MVLPWHHNELVVAIGTTVVVSVASALIISWISGKMESRKKKRKN